MLNSPEDNRNEVRSNQCISSVTSPFQRIKTPNYLNSRINPYDTTSFLNILCNPNDHKKKTLDQTSNSSGLRAILDFTTKTSKKLFGYNTLELNKYWPMDWIKDYSMISPIYRSTFLKDIPCRINFESNSSSDSSSSNSQFNDQMVNNENDSWNLSKQKLDMIIEESRIKKKYKKRDTFRNNPYITKKSNSHTEDHPGHENEKTEDLEVPSDRNSIFTKPIYLMTRTPNNIIVYQCLGSLLNLSNLSNVQISIDLTDCFQHSKPSLFLMTNTDQSCFPPEAKIFLTAQYLIKLDNNCKPSRDSLLQYFKCSWSTVLMFCEFGLSAEIILPSQIIWVLQIITSISLGKIHVMSSAVSLKEGVLEALQKISYLQSVIYIMVIYQHQYDENPEFCIIAKDQSCASKDKEDELVEPKLVVMD